VFALMKPWLPVTIDYAAWRDGARPTLDFDLPGKDWRLSGGRRSDFGSSVARHQASPPSPGLHIICT
jgi:hypothetical protein